MAATSASTKVDATHVINHVVIGVDESHSDSLEAIQGGLSFLGASARPDDAKATLFSVVSKASGTEDILKKRLEKIYKDITEDYARANPMQKEPIQFHAISPFGSDSVAVSLIKEANKQKANLIAIGAGKVVASGALGSVANEIVLRSSNAHVLICKRSTTNAKFQQNKPRHFLLAVDGSIASREGLHELVTYLCKKGDTIRCVTVSDNSKDLAMVEEEVAHNNAIIAERGVDVHCEHVPRRNKTAAEVLCELATEEANSEKGLQALVVGSSNGSSTELGSCTKWCVGKCPVSVLVMKISVTM